MVKKVSGIYQIKNKINNKIYIGSSNYIKRRWQEHRRSLIKNKHPNPFLQNAWNKYGEKSFEFSIIEIVLDKNNLLIREQYWIDSSNCCDRTIGYNISPIANSRLGTHIGEEHPNSKVNENDVRIICERIIKGETIASIAKDYSIGIVMPIRRGLTWTHITKEYIDKFPLIKSTKELRDQISSDDVYNLYLQLNNMDKVSEELGVTRAFVKKRLVEYGNIMGGEIIKKEEERIEVKKNAYLFSGLIRCSNCGAKFRGKIQRNKKVYICNNNSKDANKCERFVVFETDLINVITSHIQCDVVILDSIDFMEAKLPVIKIYYKDGTQSILSPNHYLV